MTRRWVSAVAALVVVGILAVWIGSAYGRSKNDEGSRASDRGAVTPVTVQTEVVRLASEPSMHEVSGVVSSRWSSDLAAKVMGRVTSVTVTEGDRVRAGQPLVWLDSSDLRASVDQAQAAVRSARAGVSSAAVASRMEKAASEARISASRAMVAQAEAALKSAKARRDLVIKGPRKQERAQAALAVAQAKAAMELALADYERARSLVAEGAVSQQQLDAARTRADVARAQYEQAVESKSIADEGSRVEDIRSAEEGVTQAQAALDMARQSLRQSEAAALMVNVRESEVRAASAQVKQSEAAARGARIIHGMSIVRAPFDGVVARRMVDPGHMASPGMPLLTVDGGGLRFEAAVPETLVAATRPGTTGTVILDALPEASLSARVVEVMPQGDTATHTFLVRLAIPDDTGAKSGMFGRARFVSGSDTGISVPMSSTIERDGLHYVYVVNDAGKARLRLVTLGRTLGTRVRVLSGLSSGERVVVEGVSRLADGMRVRF